MLRQKCCYARSLTYYITLSRLAARPVPTCHENRGPQHCAEATCTRFATSHHHRRIEGGTLKLSLSQVYAVRTRILATRKGSISGREVGAWVTARLASLLRIAHMLLLGQYSPPHQRPSIPSSTSRSNIPVSMVEMSCSGSPHRIHVDRLQSTPLAVSKVAYFLTINEQHAAQPILSLPSDFVPNLCARFTDLRHSIR